MRADPCPGDRALYKAAVRAALQEQPNLDLFQQAVDDLIVDNDRVTGVVTQMGLRFMRKAVVLTVAPSSAGASISGWRTTRAVEPVTRRAIAGAPPAELPFNVRRLKTGTPPRIDSRSIDFSVLAQPGDDRTGVLVHGQPREDHPQQVPCFITCTNEAYPRGDPRRYVALADVHTG